MRRTLAVLVSVVAILGLLGPPAFAQAPAPAPKVTINGLLDFVTTMYKNSTGEAGGTGATTQARDVTTSRDKGWYSRERGVFTITGEVGRSKGVLALEFDFHNGHTTQNFQDAGFGGDSGLDAETDEKNQVEVKWLYLETPITGAGSLMPFIPVTSIGRFGGQPASGIDYKPGILFTGDFPGVTLTTTWAPNLRSTLFYTQIEEALDRVNNPPGNGGFKVADNWGIGAAAEVDVFKGLTVKPTYVYFFCKGGCQSSTGNRSNNPVGTANGTGVFARGGFDPGSGTGAQAGGQATLLHERHTLGGDVRWTAGPWSLQPTFLYQFGKQQVRPANNDKADDSVDIRAYIFDVIGGFRTGPLSLEGRVLYTPGMKIKDCVDRIAGVCGGGNTIHYYEPLMQGTAAYWAGWSEIEGSGIDYNLSLRSPGSGAQLGRSPSYDKYGRIALGAAGDYSLTPALTFHAVTIFQWAAEKVDRGSRALTTSTGGGGISLQPVGSDTTSRFLGHEWDLGLTYRFAPNVAFDLIGAVLFVGEARDTARTVAANPSGAIKEAQDAYKLSARVRVTW